MRFKVVTTYKKSSFKYWFAHWCAFNMTALNLGCWKWKFLLHDIEKPWMLKFWFQGDYKKLQKWHREHSNHHPGNGADDYLAMVIDWECSRFTKPQAQLNARDTLDKFHPELKDVINPILKQLNL